MVAAREYAAFCGGRVTFAYVGISGVKHGTRRCAPVDELLSRPARQGHAHRRQTTIPAAKAATEEEVRNFATKLLAHHIPVSRRYAGGREIGAAADAGRDTNRRRGLLSRRTAVGRPQVAPTRNEVLAVRTRP